MTTWRKKTKILKQVLPMRREDNISGNLINMFMLQPALAT